MSFENWKHIANDIYLNYSKYDGFVILHGTDTMAYTASALSFMLENLGKTVIISGSQIPIFQVVSDGRDNFISSIILAGSYNIPEVTVFFNHKLFRGNRVTKTSSNNFNAFESHNMAPLATVGVKFQVNENIILRPDSIAKFNVHLALNSNVVILRLFPSIPLDVVRTFFNYPIEGVVIQSYGSGNMPTQRLGLFELLAEASARGIIIVNCTQCIKGSVQQIYETSKLFADVGVISGKDMTAEAALTKLAYILGKSEWDLDRKKAMMTKSLRGELTQPADSVSEYNSLIDNISRSLKLTHPTELLNLQQVVSQILMSSAVLQNNLEKVQNIFDSGINIHAINADQRSALHMAAGSANLNVIRFLLLKGLSVHAKDSFGQTALHEAIRHERADVVDLLIANGANLDSSTIGDHLTRCAANGDLTRLRLYATAGADLNTPNRSGRTALHEACLHNKEEIVKYLLHTNVDVNSRDLLGMAAIDLAKTLNFPKIIQMFNHFQLT